jgi:hypothetical protein
VSGGIARGTSLGSPFIGEPGEVNSHSVKHTGTLQHGQWYSSVRGRVLRQRQWADGAVWVHTWRARGGGEWRWQCRPIPLRLSRGARGPRRPGLGSTMRPQHRRTRCGRTASRTLECRAPVEGVRFDVLQLSVFQNLSTEVHQSDYTKAVEHSTLYNS